MGNSVKNIIRALRLPFATASILPFICGSLIALPNFNLIAFALGLIAAVCTHLSANLLNDYADSKSGVDWKDRKFYGFFGGSKLIQEGVFSESFYLKLALVFGFIAVSSVVGLGFMLRSPLIGVYYLVIVILGWAYSAKPLQLSYHCLGEFIIFILFGPALVMGGFFIQTRLFPTLDSFMLSLPFAFLTTAILYANEVPDFLEDQSVGKINLVSVIGQKRAYMLYDVLIACAYLSILANIYFGFLNHHISLFAFLGVLFTLRATKILKNEYANKEKLMRSSALTIRTHTIVSIILIIDMVL